MELDNLTQGLKWWTSRERIMARIEHERAIAAAEEFKQCMKTIETMQCEDKAEVERLNAAIERMAKE